MYNVFSGYIRRQTPSSRTPIRDPLITHKFLNQLQSAAEGDKGRTASVYVHTTYSTHLPQRDSGFAPAHHTPNAFGRRWVHFIPLSRRPRDGGWVTDIFHVKPFPASRRGSDRDEAQKVTRHFALNPQPETRKLISLGPEALITKDQLLRDPERDTKSSSAKWFKIT